MRNVRVFSICIAVLGLLICSGSSYASGGYDQLYWIDAKGYILHDTAERGVVITSFIRYRQYSQEGDKVKPGYFQCNNNGIDLQISVYEIKQIRLKDSVKSFNEKLGKQKLRELVLILRDGRSFEVTVDHNMGASLANHPYIELKYYNAVTQKYEFGGFAGDTIREINFE